ncbi:U11/U12 small nuclear ribonucleoprotein 48 kDa protein [Gryllus bimaculatus]|nr:U11/U12 small nuclear ribonucleoprotein 48 kDa protein [Gryllus bimaculatus]
MLNLKMDIMNNFLDTGNLEAGIRLVPKTSDRLTADFTSDERRILYDFVISKTKPVEDVKVEELQLIGDLKRDEQPRPKSKLELLIEQRDAKRRRISYKKKVHTNRKTHTEILREVIQNQMDLVEQIIKGECDDEMAVDDDDKDETFSLGGDEVNISSQPKNENKSSHEVRKAAYVSDKERSSEKKVIKKDVGKYGSVPPENVERRYSRSEQSSESCLEKHDAYIKYEKYSSERKRHNDGHASSSFGEKAGRDKYYVNNNKGGERFRDYHYDRDNNHYPSRVNSEEVDDYLHYSKNSAKQDRSEFRKQYYSHSKHVKYSSKRDNYVVNSKDERETGSQTKRYKYSSKHSSSEHDWKHERKYEAIPEKSSARSHKGDYTDKHSDHYDVHLQKFHREDKYDICKNGSVINDWSSEQKDVKFKAEDDEISPESKKYSKKTRP